MPLGDLRIFHIILVIILRLWLVVAISAVSSVMVYILYSGYAAAALSIMSFLGILYYSEDQFVYHPTLPSHSRIFVPRPSGHNLPFENIKCPSKDGTMLHMFLIRQVINSDSIPTIVFFHGNAGNMGHRLQNTAGLYHNLCVNILMAEYRGYGLSEGSPSESGLYKDAQAAVDYLYTRSDIDHSRIVIFGRSLGGAVAIDLVSNKDYSNRIWCMIVENTFTSIPAMAKTLLGWKFLKILPLICYKNKFLSINKVKRLAVPSLFICGQADGFVPPSMGESLHASCSSSFKKLARVPSGGHNDTWTCRGYYDIIKNFLQEVPPHNKLPVVSNILQV